MTQFNSIETQQQFESVVIPSTAGVTVPILLTTPKVFTLNPDFSRHLVWIAAGAYTQTDAINGATRWYCQGELRFFRNESFIGAFFFDDSSHTAAAFFTSPTRPIIRARADGSGSNQPILRYQEESNPAYGRDNLDIACFDLSVNADRVEYVLTDAKAIVGVATSLGIRLGARIVSLQ